MRILYRDPDDERMRLSEFNDIFQRTDGETDEYIGLECDSEMFDDCLIFYMSEDECERFLEKVYAIGYGDLTDYVCAWYHEEEGYFGRV